MKAKHISITDPASLCGVYTIYDVDSFPECPIIQGDFTSVTDLSVTFGKGVVVKGTDVETDERRTWVLSLTVPVVMEVNNRAIIETPYTYLLDGMPDPAIESIQ